ncbi:MAG: diguanylate cyclase [Gemmatimonadaceae bacterium]
MARRPTRILIVDDHEDNVEILRARLEASGFETVAANNGLEAIEKVRSTVPDVMLLDVMMPGIDGHEVARRIRADPALPFMPIIMQTALESTEAVVEGLDAGADDYITKPINFMELEARVRSMLRIKELHDAVTAANAELNRMAITDGLTGLCNRRHLEERLREMVEHSQRLHDPLSCLMCDLDHFKIVNDTYGHQAGDEVLKQLAKILKGCAREVDRVGRYGGEEFMILLPGTVMDAGVTFAERMRQEVESHTFTFEGGTLRRTISCGVSGWPHPRIRHREALVKAADDALYVAKERGRNRVVRFDGAEFNSHIRDSDDKHADAAVGGGGAQLRA